MIKILPELISTPISIVAKINKNYFVRTNSSDLDTILAYYKCNFTPQLLIQKLKKNPLSFSLSSIFNHSNRLPLSHHLPLPSPHGTCRSEESREIIMVDRGGERMIQAYREERRVARIKREISPGRWLHENPILLEWYLRSLLRDMVVDTRNPI